MNCELRGLVEGRHCDSKFYYVTYVYDTSITKNSTLAHGFLTDDLLCGSVEGLG